MVERVLKLIETKTYGNEKDFALQIGIKQQTINNYTKRKRTVSLDAVIAILTAYEDVSAEWLLRGKGEMLISDNLPKFHGEESDSELDVHAELSRKTAELEELKLQVLRLDAQKDYLQERNDDLVISCRMLQDELNKYQEPKKKKSIV